MAKYKTIPIETVRQLLDYNPDTGELFYKERSVEMFSDSGQLTADHIKKVWNARYAGKQAFLTKLQNRYYRGNLVTGMFLAHRVIWALVYGEWPDEVDHKDHNGFNNKLDNLRSVSHETNGKNHRLNRINTSGACGVHWDACLKKWKAQIGFRGTQTHLGLFDNKEEAIAVRKAAEIKYGFHPNHGKHV